MDDAVQKRPAAEIRSREHESGEECKGKVDQHGNKRHAQAQAQRLPLRRGKDALHSSHLAPFAA